MSFKWVQIESAGSVSELCALWIDVYLSDVIIIFCNSNYVKLTQSINWVFEVAITSNHFNSFQPFQPQSTSDIINKQSLLHVKSFQKIILINNKKPWYVEKNCNLFGQTLRIRINVHINPCPHYASLKFISGRAERNFFTNFIARQARD